MAEKDNNADKTLSQEIVDQMTKLSSAGFGVVAALAWNEAIQAFIKTYVQSYIDKYGAKFAAQFDVFYKFFYAIIITLLIVFVTYQLSKLSARLQHIPPKSAKK